MTIPPSVVTAARFGWKWQWNQLMNALAPADAYGNYRRPPSEHHKTFLPNKSNLLKRSVSDLPCLVIGRSCPWAHRVWLMYQLKDLKETINLLIVNVDHQEGQWKIDPPWLDCNSLLELYKLSSAPPKYRATVPLLVDPIGREGKYPLILGNESADLVQALNKWPSNKTTLNLEPNELKEEIDKWQTLIQESINNGVYRCGFARNQASYNNACSELFEALNQIENSLGNKGPWLCGEKMTIADIRLFPTLIRWEMVYEPLFNCTQKPLWTFNNLWKWRQNLMGIKSIAQTCDSLAWRHDYFGALFPLRPNGIIPKGPNLIELINYNSPTQTHIKE